MGDDLTQAVLGERLRLGRKRADLSQEQVAARTGIPRTALSDVECGHRRVDSLELKKLSDVYGESLDHFLGGAPPVVSGPEALVQRLETVTANLHGYLEQRAEEIAQPRIEAAEASAAREVTAAEHQTQREQDLVAELRRQLVAALRNADRAERALRAHHEGENCERCRRPAPVQGTTYTDKETPDHG